jgi:parallel beta-helix repeat protein
MSSSIDPLYAMVDQTVTIAATIHNDGLIVADSLVVRFYNGDPATGGTQIGADQTVSSLLGGDSAPVSVHPAFSTVGKHDIYVVADADNQVEEISETNNEAFIPLYVQYPTIQGTINAAPQHGTIYIAPGTYYENVLVDEPVTIVGAGRDITIIDAGGAEAAVYITADDVEFSGFTVKNTNGQYGIYVDQAAGVSLNSFAVDDPHWGVVFKDVSHFSQTNATLASNEKGGIKVQDSNDGIIHRCIIRYNGKYGIRIQDDSNEVTITNCLIEDNNDYGISIQDSNNISVGNPADSTSGNTITGTHKYGIYNQESDYTTIVYNDINGYSNTGIWDIGIWDIDTGANYNSGSVIKHNTVDGNQGGHYGIQTQWVNADMVRHNTFKYNTKWGAKAWPITNLINCFNWNTFIGNAGAYYYDPVPGTQSVPLLFDGNVFINNTVAIRILGAGSLFMASNNTITGSQIAIYCESGSPTIEDNDMSDNVVGIYIESGAPTITGNTVTENAIGVYVSEVSDPIMYDNEIYANTADTTTTPPILTIDALIGVVESMELQAGIESSLILKLNAANEALLRGQISAAINQLTAFINEVEAQRDDHITDSQADELIAAATTTAHGLSYLLRNSIGA